MGLWLKLNSCCLCFGLRTGTLILLWIGLIHAILFLVSAIVDIIEKSEDCNKRVIMMSMYCVGVVILGVLPCGFGLYGVYKKQPEYLRMYVIISLGAIICWMGLLIGLAFEWVELPHSDKTNGDNPVLSAAFIIIISCSVYYYFTSVIQSYYWQMKKVLNIF